MRNLVSLCVCVCVCVVHDQLQFVLYTSCSVHVLQMSCSVFLRAGPVQLTLCRVSYLACIMFYELRKLLFACCCAYALCKPFACCSVYLMPCVPTCAVFCVTDL